jgi:uncharacterized protein YhfF
MNAETLWADYCAAIGESGPVPPIDVFGDNPAMNDELLDLVLEGTKRATCCLARDFAEGDQPKIGDYWIIADGAGTPRAIIRTCHIELKAICDVDDSFAHIEGEGDKSLAYWKTEHDAYFQRQATAEGFVYDDSMIGICEQFDCVWPQ